MFLSFHTDTFIIILHILIINTYYYSFSLLNNILLFCVFSVIFYFYQASKPNLWHWYANFLYCFSWFSLLWERRIKVYFWLVCYSLGQFEFWTLQVVKTTRIYYPLKYLFSSAMQPFGTSEPWGGRPPSSVNPFYLRQLTIMQNNFGSLLL